MLELYLPVPSWIHQTDPRVKLVWVLCSLIVCLLAKNLFVMLGLLLLAHGLFWAARIPPGNLAAVWKTLLPVGALMGLLWVLFYPSGAPVFQFWIITITPLSVAQGLVLALRILNVGLVFGLWLYTTDSVAIVASLVKLRVPFEWGLVLALALRYIPLVQESYAIISAAQQARGLDIMKGNVFRRARAMLPIFIAMMISALRASDRLAIALEARGFGARGTARTSLYEMHAQPRDLFLLALILLLFGAFLYLNIGLGMANQAFALF